MKFAAKARIALLTALCAFVWESRVRTASRAYQPLDPVGPC